MSSVYVTETSTITSNCGPRTRMAGLTGRHDNTAPELQLNKAKRPTVSALQVVPASQNTNQTQLPELGYEVTRSGPTTNFVGTAYLLSDSSGCLTACSDFLVQC